MNFVFWSHSYIKPCEHFKYGMVLFTYDCNAQVVDDSVSVAAALISSTAAEEQLLYGSLLMAWCWQAFRFKLDLQLKDSLLEAQNLWSDHELEVCKVCDWSWSITLQGRFKSYAGVGFHCQSTYTRYRCYRTIYINESRLEIQIHVQLVTMHVNVGNSNFIEVEGKNSKLANLLVYNYDQQNITLLCTLRITHIVTSIR